MNWLAYAIFAGLLLTLQSTAAAEAAVFGARPDLLVATAAFLSLFGRPRDAAIGAWLLGAGLLTVERFGLMSLSYLLAAVSISSIRLYVFRGEALTQMVVVLVAALAVNGICLIYRHLLYDPAESVLRGMAASVVFGSVYSAVVAVPLFGVLRRIAPALGMPRMREPWAAARYG
jgi:hypothetical protein